MIHPGGEVEVLSTHEQLLGGPSGQTYLGCQFPARDHYRCELQRWGLAVGLNWPASEPWTISPLMG